jgi:hypothetical protein
MADIWKSDKSVKGFDSSWSNSQGLEITKGELKHLTGFDLDGISLHKPLTLRRSITRRTWLEYLSVSLIPIYFLFVKYIAWVIFSDIDAEANTHNAPAISVILSFLVTTVIYLKIREFFANKRIPKTIIPLFEEVSKYNQLAQILEVQDQLEAAGNPVVLSNREKTIEALELTRADLVRALKTERILRENKDIISIRPELFENNLIALRTLQVNEQASESGQLLNEALQVAVGVQEEMKKLQNQR